MSRTANSSDAATSWWGPRTRQASGLPRNARSASTSPGSAVAGDHVAQPEDEQGVGVGQVAFVERGAETGLVDVR
ncbi:hypothetical protein ABT168_02680 [Streptomyces sp. NPDC001793]|uniref:hypothetical protein n=1 Tax=Streptomyces sp. NPDC001793 TaxID=3154657 RepID=UPI00332F7971